MTKHFGKTGDLHVTQNKQQQNDAGFENSTFKCIQKENIPINGEIDWEIETNPMKLYYIWFNEVLAMDTFFLSSALTLLCFCLHNIPRDVKICKQGFLNLVFLNSLPSVFLGPVHFME